MENVVSRRSRNRPRAIRRHERARACSCPSQNYACLLMSPLVKAVTKVTNIKKNLKNSHQSRQRRGLTDMEAAGVETAHKLVAMAHKNKAQEDAEFAD
ncbi:hypothetical protein BO79DRAFT_245110 [Aspergillus costaricaensis CBS 115574]|uniref:Uncharacterized protein n=1 Tax=Aspergillus costaricaensis CBS 115574 TaxID=1448317 RepID=A0ACD1IG08_9EURO|nr:hypothetical protein BO79DRAFT_245110 [Aspergillus costaricaensis CBS 115574]RAK89176.1 hypothetical protein BO79DRAFT_245110 [Aspergillus costaricaensis CBS 115574]